jgi:hypothetical protein
LWGFFQETKLQLFSLLGTKEREWVLESTIRYIKVISLNFSAVASIEGNHNGASIAINW